MLALVALLVPAALALAVVVRVLLVRRARAARLARLASIDPDAGVAELDALMRETFLTDLPFETASASAFGGGNAFAARLIAKAFLQTGKLKNNPVLRTDETFRPIFMLWCLGVESEESQAVIRKINHIHSFYRPEKLFMDEDCVFVGVCLVASTIRFIEHWGWRPLLDNEKRALFLAYQKVVDRLTLSNAFRFPEDLGATMRYYDDRLDRSEANPESKQVMFEFLEYLWECGWVPRSVGRRLRPHTGAIAAALQPYEPRVLRLFGYTRPPAFLRWTLGAILSARGWVMRNMVMPSARAWDPAGEGLYPWLLRGWPSYQPHTEAPLPAPDAFAPEYDARKSPRTGCPFHRAGEIEAGEPGS